MFYVARKYNISPSQEFHTPNNTYKKLEEASNTTIIKDSEGKTDEDYEDAVIDHHVSNEKAELFDQ